jgi:hypothetical protein
MVLTISGGWAEVATDAASVITAVFYAGTKLGIVLGSLLLVTPYMLSSQKVANQAACVLCPQVTERKLITTCVSENLLRTEFLHAG